MIVLVNARIYRFDAGQSRFVRHDTLAIEGDRIRSLDAAEIGAEVARIDMQGATVLPAFADCHVHLDATGYYAGSRSLRGVRSYRDFADAVPALPRDGEILYAGQYDDAGWERPADAAPLERIPGNVRAMLVRIDGHSCVVNRATIAWLDLASGTPGIERDAQGVPTGKLSLEANWRAQSAMLAAFTPQMRAEANRRAVEIALSRGALHLHAQLLGLERDAYAREIAMLRETGAKIHPKVCEPDASLAVELGLPYIGGDVFLDGSIGSCTAALHEPYSSSRGCGALRFSDDALLGYFAQAESLGIAAGVHAIGDAAIEQALRTWERVLAGKPSLRGARHFIEHFEMASEEHIDACVRMGIHLSMQPQFDATWGEPGGMYEERLGRERTRSMNALARIVCSGAIVCGGDDSPVCPLDPLAGMQACIDHHEPEHRLTPSQALALYTVNAARLGYAQDVTGNIAPGLCADLVVLDRDPMEAGRFADARVLQTWRDGRTVYDSGDLSA